MKKNHLLKSKSFETIIASLLVLISITFYSCYKNNPQQERQNQNLNLIKSALTENQVAMILENFGTFNENSVKKTISEKRTIFSVEFLNNNNHLNRKLLVAFDTSNGVPILKSYIFELNSPNFSIENLKLKKYDGFINGSISLVSLNDNSVYTFEKNLVGEIEYEQSINERYKNIRISQDVSGEKLSSNTERVIMRKFGFGSCFKSCFANHWSNLNWVEKAACVIASEECAAAFLIGCTIECRAELT